MPTKRNKKQSQPPRLRVLGGDGWPPAQKLNDLIFLERNVDVTCTAECEQIRRRSNY